MINNYGSKESLLVCGMTQTASGSTSFAKYLQNCSNTVPGTDAQAGK